MDKVFKDWSSVKTNVSRDKAEFSVWGRKYVFENSFVPTSVISQDMEILDAPITMTAEFGTTVGQWKDFHYLLIENTDEKAVVVISAMCENVIANATVTVEFDGFVRIDLRLMSEWQFARDGRKKPELSKLYMNIPVRSEHSGLFHYWPNDKTSIIPSQFVMNSGKTQDIKLPFKPYIWMGDEEVGIGVFVGESDENFIAGDDCVTVSGSNIRVNFLDAMPRNWQGREDMWIDTLKPVTYTFGFHATPVKPFKRHEETYKIYHINRVHKDDSLKILYETDEAERIAALGTKWLILHEDWTVIQNYGLAEDEDKFKALIRKCHSLGLKVMVYFGYECSSLTPDFNEKCDSYLYKNENGNFTGGWQRTPHQRAFMVCYNGGYKDVFLKRVEYVMDEYGVDGIYTDGTYVPWECCNHSHGCGYIGHDGKHHHTFPVLAVREHVKKLYEIVHSRGGVIDTHQSSCCIMPTLSFCDSYFDGENIQARLSDDNMEFLNLDAFRAEYMGINYGISANFISMTNEKRTIKGLESLTLLHNVHTRSYNMENLEYNAVIWKLYDELGLTCAKWHPYWKNSLSSVDCEEAYSSAYETENGFVFYAVDFKVGRKITLSVPDGITRLTEKLTGKTYDVTDGKAVVELEQSTPNFFVAD